MSSNCALLINKTYYFGLNESQFMAKHHNNASKSDFIDKF